MDDRIGFRGPASNAFRLLYDDLASPCPQCARFREKIDREKMAKVIRTTWAEIYWSGEIKTSSMKADETADALITYLTE